MKRVLLAMALLITCTACGGLSRSQALSVLNAATPLNAAHYIDHELLVSIGRLAPNCIKEISGDYDIVSNDPEYALLDKIGYLTVRPTIKPLVWNVELTELGTKSLADDKYAHETRGDCDKWQVTLPLSRFDHFEVTGIVQDGVHAKVDVAVHFMITPLGMAARKVARSFVFEHIKHQNIFMTNHLPDEEMVSSDTRTLIGADLVSAAPEETKYTKSDSVEFEKSDNGWRILKPKQ